MYTKEDKTIQKRAAHTYVKHWGLFKDNIIRDQDENNLGSYLGASISTFLAGDFSDFYSRKWYIDWKKIFWCISI